MSTPNFAALLARDRAYFRNGVTRSADWREGQLTAPTLLHSFVRNRSRQDAA